LEPDRVRELVRQNDNDARRELFEAYYRRTFAVVYNILRRRENAEDITQDAFIKAFQNIHQLHDSEKFGAWLAVIASNLARNNLKREKRMVITDDLTAHDAGDSVSNTETEALRSLETDRVRKAIKALPPEHYQVIVLQYYDDLKVEEIARLLKISPGTVKSRLFRARQKLAGHLEPGNDPNCLNTKGGDPA
jgi:RNA polymerase sigma factor (sigma-70 family)